MNARARIPLLLVLCSSLALTGCQSESDGEVHLWTELFESHCYDLQRTVSQWRSMDDSTEKMLASEIALVEKDPAFGGNRDACWLTRSIFAARNAWAKEAEARASRLAGLAPQRADAMARSLSTDLGRDPTLEILQACECGLGKVGPLSELLATFRQKAPVARDKLQSAAAACKAHSRR